MIFFKKIKKSDNIRHDSGEIEPDEIFLDSSNLPEFNRYQFEGRLEKPISKKTIIFLGSFFSIIVLSFVFKLWTLQVEDGRKYYDLSENNHLDYSIVFSERGVIYDRNKIKLVWNISNTKSEDFFNREYLDVGGLSHLLGYVSYPKKDKDNNFYQKDYIGKSGLEKTYNSRLNGENGLKIIEVDALSHIQSESVVRMPKNGDELKLSIDYSVQSALYGYIEGLAKNVGFSGGAGILIDVNNGEILAITSYPEYNSNILISGENGQAISSYTKDKSNPFLNRTVNGLYTPGSIVKPFMAIAALNEGVITPDKKILSTGSISVPNPYLKDKKSVFTDWKAHGWVDVRHALAMSSNVYFYEIGGGFQDQKGLGITKIGDYFRLFGFGAKTGIDFFNDEDGVVPNPEWKKEQFNGEDWRLGDTYHTSIGQYGFQVTLIQVAKGIASIANNGRLVTPTILLGETKAYEAVQLPVKKEIFKVVQEGMRLCAIEGTAKGINAPFVEVAAKTGTAELGVSKKRVNSWVVGFFPYDKPKYAFVVLMESGPRENLVGGTYVMRQLLEWMHTNTPQYL